MAITDMVANGVASITGKIAKANILIKDNRKDWSSALDKANNAVSSGMSAKDALSAAGSKIGSGKIGGLGAVNKLASLADKATGGNLGFDKSQKLLDAMNDGYNKVFEVQFNPSSLSLSGMGGGKRVNYNYMAGDGNEYSNNDTRIALNVRLIFSKEDLSQAFPGDTMAINATTGANKIMNLAKDKLLNNNQPSVQMVVEGFVGAIRNPSTRLIAFQWGDLYYEGLLKNVNTNYTLFDATGRPVRAEVDMTINLRDEEVTMKMNDPNLGHWQTAYDKAFSSSTSYISSMQKLVRKFTGDRGVH